MLNNLKNIYKNKIEDSYVLVGLFIFLASQTGNFFRFLLQLLLVRSLAPKQYSELEALLAILSLGSSPIYVLGPVISKHLAKCKALGDKLAIKTFISNTIRNLAVCGIITAIIIFLFRFQLQHFLKFDTATPFLWLAIIVFLTFLYPATLGSIQGLQYFVYMGIAFAIPPFIKMLSAALFIHFGFGLNGILFSYTLAAFLVIAIAFIPLHKHFAIKGKSTPNKTKELIKQSMPIVFTMQLFFVLIFVDTILVKNLFNNYMAATYASMAILGKIVLFLPISLFNVMLPKVSAKHILKEDTRHILFNTLKITTLANVGLIALFYFFADPIVPLLFKGKYLEGIHLLVYFAIAMSFFNLSITLMIYNIAKENNILLIPFTIAAILQPTMIYLFHSSLDLVIQIVCITSFLLFIVNVTVMLTQHKKTKDASK